MIKRITLYMILATVTVAHRLAAQTIEILFTQSGVAQALALKKSLKVEKAEAFAATALVNASAERKQAYIAKVGSNTAIVIVGEDALKATSDVAFTVPALIVNAVGPTAAKSRVVRLFDSGFKGTPPASAKAITTPDAASALLGQGTEVLIKCDGVPAGEVVQTLLGSLK